MVHDIGCFEPGCTALKGMAFELFWSEKGLNFESFGLKSGMVSKENTRAA